MPRGYYDAEGTGVGAVDYGRYVGPNPGMYWSVALARSPKEQYTARGEFGQPPAAQLMPAL